MTSPILAGIETEYGLLVEGRGAEDQIDDSQQVIRSYPGHCFVGWDYRFESPRSDLRGFTQARLNYDPEDAKFDAGRHHRSDSEVRSDRVLPNGARLYNDHGHPEYSTPECLSLRELALHDKAGEIAVLRAAAAYSEHRGLDVRLYKNNTDFHGASYGTHESYLVPREIGYERLYRAVMPMLIARQILCGAGKVGSETGESAPFQLSQRADFFTESASVDTLFRRPVFNTRDEPHGDPEEWIRLHVIAGDANMMASCTARKVGLVKIALSLAGIGQAPVWEIPDPVRAFQKVSRDMTREFRVPLKGANWTVAYEIIDSYLSAYERLFAATDDPELLATCVECRSLCGALRNGEDVSSRIDWAAKLAMLQHYMEEEGTDWADPALRSFDLEYHNPDPAEGLYAALAEMGSVEPLPYEEDLLDRLSGNFEPTRALARGLAVSKFSDRLLGVSWASLIFRGGHEPMELYLPPDHSYPAQLEAAKSVEEFIEILRGA
jgi:Pup amidohydrolase